MAGKMNGTGALFLEHFSELFERAVHFVKCHFFFLLLKSFFNKRVLFFIIKRAELDLLLTS